MADLEKTNAVDRNESLSHMPPLGPNKTVDTVHNDEALKVFAEYTGEREWSTAEEKRLRRKIDWRLMPVLCITYGLQYYDKAMLSQAVCSQGLRPLDDIELTCPPGLVWTQNRLGTAQGQPLLILSSNLLPRIHHWHVSNDVACSKISY